MTARAQGCAGGCRIQCSNLSYISDPLDPHEHCANLGYISHSLEQLTVYCSLQDIWGHPKSPTKTRGTPKLSMSFWGTEEFVRGSYKPSPLPTRGIVFWFAFETKQKEMPARSKTTHGFLFDCWLSSSQQTWKCTDPPKRVILAW